MNNNNLYHERLTSNKTEALFLALTTLFLVLLAWRVTVASFDALAVVFLVFAVLFLFYSLNYRTLLIRLTDQSLKLKFGIFTWTVALGNIETCVLDHVPAAMRNGGAGCTCPPVRARRNTGG